MELNPTAPATAPDPIAESQTDNSNSTIKAMREQIEAAHRARKEAERQAQEFAARLKEREDAELSEMDKLKRELDELKPLRDSHGKFASRMEALYHNELAAVPDEKRRMVEKLSDKGDWADRLEALQAAKALLGTSVKEAAMGSVIAPGNKMDSSAPPTLSPVELRQMSWTDAFRASR